MGNFANEMTSLLRGPGGARAVFSDDAIVEGIGPGQPARADLRPASSSTTISTAGSTCSRRTDTSKMRSILVQASQQYAQPAQLFWNCHCQRGFAFVAPAGARRSRDAGGRTRRGRMPTSTTTATSISSSAQIGRAAASVPKRAAARPSLAAPASARRGSEPRRDRARVRVRTGDVVQERTVMPARSYLSQVELPITFGLGAASSVDEVEIRWPDGAVGTMPGPPVDAEHGSSRQGGAT